MHLPKLGLWKIGMAVNHVPREGYAMSRNLVSKACAFLAGLFLVLAAIASPTAIFAHDDQHHALAAPTGGGPHGPNLGSDMATAASSMGGMAMDDDAPVWPATFGGRVLTWLGKWHVAVVHFPIALFIVVAIVEASARVIRKPEWAGSDRLLVALAALSTVAAAILGWLAMGLDMPKDDFVHIAHRLLGTALAVFAIGVWWAKERAYASRSRGARRLYSDCRTRRNRDRNRCA